METGEGKEPIAVRLARLNQLITGRSSSTPEQKSLLNHDGLLDSLLVLYDECSNDYLARNQYAASFIKKYASLISELKKLRLSIGDFNLKGIVGRGHFGEVQVVSEKQTGDVYAMKMLRKMDTLSQQNVSFYEEERDIMAKATSPWITKLHYAFQDRRNLYLVMDFHPGGDLLSLLSRYDDIFEESMAKFYVAEMVLAIHALHNMGFVHRDIKPENILIDRTGHIKLADFGSACQTKNASSSISNLPVGTPDYICPEVLIRMNSDQKIGCFGEECDWWSLGVCTYEMLYGRTPFTDHDTGSMVSTYANIMNHKKCLAFSKDRTVSEDVKNLIESLLTDPADRLNYEQIRVHRFFLSIDFDNIRQTRPPFIPTVSSNDDTSNFDDFTRAKSVHFPDLMEKRTEFSGKDLPFVGFTFTKNVLPNDQSSVRKSVDEFNPSCKTTLERRLTLKSGELQCIREKYKDLEVDNQTLKMEVESLKKSLHRMEENVQAAVGERNKLEMEVPSLTAENNGLRRSVELERQKVVARETEISRLVSELTQVSQKMHNLQEDDISRLSQQTEEYQEVIAQLQEDRRIHINRISSLEKELMELAGTKKSAGDSKIEELRARIKIEFKDAYRSKLKAAMEKMKKRDEEFSRKEKQLTAKLEEAKEQCFEVRRLLQAEKDDKAALNSELQSLANQFSVSSSRLSITEDRCKSLESQTFKVRLLEERERELTCQMKEKSNQVIALATRIADQDEEIQKLRIDKLEVENRSFIVFEENEERLQKVHEQEMVISLLKTNVNTLEQQLNSLKCDLLEVKSPAYSSKSRIQHNRDNQVKAANVSEAACRIPEKVSTACSPVVFPKPDSTSDSDSESDTTRGDGVRRKERTRDALFTFSYKIPSGKMSVRREILDTSGSTYESNLMTSSSMDTQSVETDEEPPMDNEGKMKSVVAQTSFSLKKSPTKRSMQVQTSFIDRKSSPVRPSMRSEIIQCDMPRTSIAKCSAEMQTSFCEESRRSSPSKRQASLAGHELDESPSKKSNKEEQYTMPKSCRFDCPDECIDDLVEANSDSSRGVDVTISARLRCRKHLGRGKFVEQHQGSASQEGATSSAADAGQSVAFTFAGELYERSEKSRKSLEDLSTFAEKYEVKVEENRRQAFVVEELRQRNEDLEKQVTSTHLSLNEKVELEKQVNCLLKEKASLEQEVDRLRIQNQGLSKKETEMLALKFNFNNQVARIETLELQKVDLEKRVNSTQTLQHENANLERRMDELRSENADLVNRVTRLTQRMEEKAGHVAQAHVERELQAEKDIREKNVKIEKLELQRAGFEKQVTSIGALQQEKAKLEKRVEELQIENAVLKEKVNHLTSLLEETSSNEARILAKTEKDLTEKMATIETLELQKADLEKQVIRTETLLQEKAGLEKSNKELHQMNDSLGKEVAQLRSLVEEKTEQTPSVTQLQTERDRLQADVARLQKEVDETKNNIHEQRIRVLDMKHELREKTAASENEIALLTFKLSKAEASAKDATESATKCRERETEIKSKLDEAQTELIQVRDELKQNVAELKSQKSDLEIQVQKLTSELETLKVSTEEARTQNAQFQSEFREATDKFLSSETKLKEQESRLHLVTSENNQLKLVNEQLKTDLDEKRRQNETLEQQNEQLKSLCKELESQIEDLETLEEHKDAELKELSEKLKSSEKLMESAKRAEENKILRELEETKARLSQHKMQAETLSAQVIQLEHNLSVVELENRSIKCHLEGSTQGAKKLKDDIANQMQSSLEEKNCLRQEGERLKQELAESKSQNEQLRYLCGELENQIKTLEEICDQQEKRLSKDQSNQSVFKRALGEQEREAEQISRQLQNERDGRRRAEDKAAELKKALASIQASGSSECERLRAQLAQQSMQLNSLNEQLTASEHKWSLMELDNKNLQRYIEVRDQEMITLKEEISKEITRLQSIKTTNLKLSKDLECAKEQFDSLVARNTDLENQMESTQANYQHDRYRREETLCQQAKLIDYLQVKVENTPRKKKLFSSKRDTPCIQLQCSENDREKCIVHRSEIVQLREDLHQAKTELLRWKCSSGDGAPMSASIPSSAAKDQRSYTLPPGRSVNSGTSTPSSVTQQKRPSERNSINNPHKFVTGINSRPSKCIVCLGPIHFVQEAAKCQDCGAVCHPKCLSDVPASCGFPNEYSRYMTDVMLKAKAASTDSMQPSVANLHLQMTGDMKISKRERQSLERKWVVLRDNKLYFYNSKEDSIKNPIDEFDLCPPDGEVSIRSAVTAVEFKNVVPSDLPYIMMLEFEPDSCTMPARRLYMMALSFKEKQHWVAAIEAIINTNLKSSRIRDLRVLGNTILRLPKDRWLEINCTWPLNDEVILVGAMSGLFAMVLTNMPDNRLLIKVEGVTTIYSILGQKNMDFLFVICGRDRDLMTIDLATVQRCIAHIRAGTRREPVSVVPQAVTMASMCTAFEVVQAVDGLYLCAATMDKVVLYKYNNSLREFLVRKEVPTNSPCSCLHFGQRRVLFGTDRFYQMDLEKYSVSEFLDKKDPSLAFAVLGATQYDSFPIAVLAVSPWNEPEEFLLCFHEVGVFVDGNGRRKREQNVKWTGLPLAFAYRAPFLYTIHFNAVQIMEIMPGHSANPIGLKTFVNVHGAQYLGPAVMPGAIYVGSTGCEGNAELICIMGNQGLTPARECKKEIASSSRRPISEVGFVSPAESTPSTFHRMSPKRSTYTAPATERNSITSNSSDDLALPTRISSSSRVQPVRQQRTPVVPSAPRLDTSTASSTYSSDI